MAALFSSVAMTTIATPPPRCLQQHHSCLKPAQKEDVIILDQQGVPGSSYARFRVMQGRRAGTAS